MKGHAMANLKWGDEYSIGVNEIDLQHREFIHIVNKIHWAKEQQYPIEVGIRLVRELHKYGEFHFICEENMMFLQQYPGLNTQIVEHRSLIAILKGKMDEFSNGKLSYDDFTNFAFKWLLNHVLEEDKKFGVFMKSKSIPKS